MRLIDADALIDCFEMRGDSDLGWHLYEVIDEINDAPTTYELDRVVEALNTNIEFYEEVADNDYEDGRYHAYEDALDIVKRGGIDE